MMFVALLAACSDPPESVPTDDAALTTFVVDGRYSAWSHEPDHHPGKGPHKGDIRVFLDDSLQASLAAGNARHPLGAASVLELYDANQAVGGWAVMVKVADEDGPDAWFWWKHYEGKTVTNGRAEQPCVNCHTPGKDFVLSPAMPKPPE